MVNADRPVALVTGASRGIGRGLSIFLLDKGYQVVGCSRHAAEPLPGAYEHVAADVSEEDSVRSLMAVIRAKHGRLDVIVNNAATVRPAVALMTTTASVDEVFRTNFLGTYLVCREGLRMMIERKTGRLVNMASIAVPLADAGTSIYSASKAAVIQFTRVLAKEVAPFNITCNVVAPSVFDSVALQNLSAEAVAHSVERLAIRRKASIEDVTNAVWFFLQPSSSYVTGQVLYLGLAA